MRKTVNWISATRVYVTSTIINTATWIVSGLSAHVVQWSAQLHIRDICEWSVDCAHMARGSLFGMYFVHASGSADARVDGVVWSELGSFFFFFSSRRRHTRSLCDWSSDVCSSD